MNRPKLKRDWVGLKVKTLVDMESGMMKIPRGTICTVAYNRAGLHLRTDPCSHCGVAVYIGRVRENHVEIV